MSIGGNSCIVHIHILREFSSDLGNLMKPEEYVLDLQVRHDFSDEEVEKFVLSMADRISVELWEQCYGSRWRDRKTKSQEDFFTEVIKPLEVESGRLDIHGKPKRFQKECVIDRIIHPTWQKKDGECVVEWLKMFWAFLSFLPSLREKMYGLLKRLATEEDRKTRIQWFLKQQQKEKRNSGERKHVVS